MIKGDCGHHAAGVPVAARVLSDRADVQRTVRAVAAPKPIPRTVGAGSRAFALRAVTHLRIWLEGEPDNLATDRSRIARPDRHLTGTPPVPGLSRERLLHTRAGPVGRPRSEPAGP